MRMRRAAPRHVGPLWERHGILAACDEQFAFGYARLIFLNGLEDLAQRPFRLLFGSVQEDVHVPSRTTW